MTRTDRTDDDGHRGRMTTPDPNLHAATIAPGDVDTAAHDGHRVHVANVEVAAEGDGDELVAWPSIYNRAYRMGAYTWHEIAPGAFAESAGDQAGRVPIYVQHSWQWSERPPVGHTTSVEDAATRADGEIGMRIVPELYTDTDDGRAVAHGLAARALREWSLGYRVLEYVAREDDDNDRTVHRITRAELLEASVVLRGANPLTSTEAEADDDQSLSVRVWHRPTADRLAATRAELEAIAAGAELEDEPTNVPDPDGPEVLAALAASSPSFRAAWRRTVRRTRH